MERATRLWFCKKGCIYIYIYLKVNHRCQISCIFIGSPHIGYQFIYLLYLIWSRNMSAIKQAEKTWPTKTISDQNKIDMEGLLILDFLICWAYSLFVSLAASFAPSLCWGTNDATQVTNKLYALQKSYDCPIIVKYMGYMVL